GSASIRCGASVCRAFVPVDSSVRAPLMFFFSSRRRHTRFSRDWSSDVCSSDLPRAPRGARGACGVSGGPAQPMGGRVRLNLLMMRSVPGDPERLGGYWLAGRLGAGRHGVGYDAYDDKGRRFAVRVPRGPAPRLRPVTRPHLAGVLAVRPGYAVSEFAAGPSLRQAPARRGPYAGEELIALATAVASALACLHAAGLVHGDLRPGKVLLADGGPKVICPGGSGSIGATRTYLAPEAVTGRQADAPGDVFAWGGLVLFAATGEDPFRGDSLGEVMHRLLSCDPDLTVLPPPLRDLVAS